MMYMNKDSVNYPIYLDYHATTPLDKRVLDSMMPYLTDMFGNASSLDHSIGYGASVAVQESREKIARSINAHMDEIIFTSGATESDNLALSGVMARYRDRGNHLITCMTEHKAVLDTARHLEESGSKVTYLPVDKYGTVSPESVEAAITDETVLISIMAANNEVGTIQDVEEIGRIAHKHDVLFHTDAAQAVGHIPVDVKKMNIDLMSFSSHKMCGPKGIGALYVRGMKPRIRLEPLLHGGGQERNMRSGTLNVPGIVGFAKAVEIARNEMDAERQKFKEWIDQMLDVLSGAGAKLNGHPENRLAHNLNVRFDGIEGKAIINSVSNKIAISAGSACTTQAVEPSHVLLAMGLSEEQAHSSIRIGCGRFNTEKQMNTTTNEILSCLDVLTKIKV